MPHAPQPRGGCPDAASAVVGHVSFQSFLGYWKLRPGVTERIIEANGVDLCTEPFGNPADPPILLVMGIGGAMLLGGGGVFRMVAAGGGVVVRYDHPATRPAVTHQPRHAPSHAGGPFARPG